MRIEQERTIEQERKKDRDNCRTRWSNSRSVKGNTKENYT